MGAPEMTSELRNDLKLLRMRNALNPSRHYKASDWKKLPRYFQVSATTESTSIEDLWIFFVLYFGGEQKFFGP